MRTVNRALLVIAVLSMVFVFQSAQAATIIIQNSDGPGEGFNDPTPVAPLPGNPNVTLGAQRLFAFQYAANLWAQCLVSNVTIIVDAKMDPLTCTATSAILGSASTNFIHNNFPGAPKVNTWYPDALADAIAGIDLNPGNPDIVATFNSNLNGAATCLGGTGWYYGADQNPGSDVDFITVVAHEIGHGLGFQTFQSSAGAWFIGLQDTYGYNMYRNGGVPPDYPSMSNAQRGSANLSDPNLVWDGPFAKAYMVALPLVGGLTGGRPRLHGPNPYQTGSSLSHWSPALNPNHLMEPSYTGALHAISGEIQLLQDIGWTLIPKGPVATAIRTFRARSENGAVELLADFASDANNFTVSVFRGEGSEDPAYLIHTRNLEAGEPFTYTDNDVVPGRTYSYRIGVQDHDTQAFSTIESASVPSIGLVLSQNVPNPFNPVTRINFTLPASQEVTLSVYDAAGRLVTTLARGVHSHGLHSIEWNGKDRNGNTVGKGIYFYRLVSGDITQSRKMVLMK